jgi:hypothetical protein
MSHEPDAKNRMRGFGRLLDHPDEVVPGLLDRTLWGRDIPNHREMVLRAYDPILARAPKAGVTVIQKFYAPTVRFHGRFVDSKGLLEEKRRLAKRWPIRDYSPVLKTMSVGCRTDAEECRIETYFTYRAKNPRTGRSAKGLGSLELVVDFASGRPLILSESSRVLRQGIGF